MKVIIQVNPLPLSEMDREIVIEHITCRGDVQHPTVPLFVCFRGREYKRTGRSFAGLRVYRYTTLIN